MSDEKKISTQEKIDRLREKLEENGRIEPYVWKAKDGDEKNLENISDLSSQRLFKTWDSFFWGTADNVAGCAKEVRTMAVAKEIFKRFPKKADKIDLPNTFRLYQTLKQSDKPEDRELLSRVEKDLQAKASLFSESKGVNKLKTNGEKATNVGENYAQLLVPPTIYSVSCFEGLKDYMREEMHILPSSIGRKLKSVEKNMLLGVNAAANGESLEADKLVRDVAKKYPDDAHSQKIIDRVNYRVSHGISKKGGRQS